MSFSTSSYDYYQGLTFKKWHVDIRLGIIWLSWVLVWPEQRHISCHTLWPSLICCVCGLTALCLAQNAQIRCCSMWGKKIETWQGGFLTPRTQMHSLSVECLHWHGSSDSCHRNKASLSLGFSPSVTDAERDDLSRHRFLRNITMPCSIDQSQAPLLWNLVCFLACVVGVFVFEFAVVL